MFRKQELCPGFPQRQIFAAALVQPQQHCLPAVFRRGQADDLGRDALAHARKFDPAGPAVWQRLLIGAQRPVIPGAAGDQAAVAALFRPFRQQRLQSRHIIGVKISGVKALKTVGPGKIDPGLTAEKLLPGSVQGQGLTCRQPLPVLGQGPGPPVEAKALLLPEDDTLQLRAFPQVAALHRHDLRLLHLPVERRAPIGADRQKQRPRHQGEKA